MTMENADPRIFKYSIEEQKDWLESLTENELKVWLRKAIWTTEIFPIAPPAIASTRTYLSEILQMGGDEFKTRLRTVLPELLREWGRNDSSRHLQILLLLIGRLRCAEAEPTIVQILEERIDFVAADERTERRRDALSVISGLGCNHENAFLFEKYIEQIDYSAICYRALYSFKRSNAAKYLFRMLEIYSSNKSLDDLRTILIILFHKGLKSDVELRGFWIEALRTVELETVPTQLARLEELGIVFDTVGEMPYQKLKEHFTVIYDNGLGWNSTETVIPFDDEEEAGIEEALIAIDRFAESRRPQEIAAIACA